MEGELFEILGRHWVPIFLDYPLSSFRQRLRQLGQERTDPWSNGVSWVDGMGEELRAGGRSASVDTRRDEPEFGMGRVTGISLPGYCP